MFSNEIFDISSDSAIFTEAIFDCMARFDKKSRMVVDRCGKLIASSSCSAAVFEKGHFLKLDRGYVLAPHNFKGDSLKRLLGVSGNSVETLTLRSGWDPGHLVVRATAFSDRLVLLSLSAVGREEEPALPNLQTLFGLTPSEAGVIYDLYQGRTPQAIAEENQNSIHTIRAHIRHSYDKLGVSCREELWSKLNEYRLR